MYIRPARPSAQRHSRLRLFPDTRVCYPLTFGMNSARRYVPVTPRYPAFTCTQQLPNAVIRCWATGKYDYTRETPDAKYFSSTSLFLETTRELSRDHKRTPRTQYRSYGRRNNMAPQTAFDVNGKTAIITGAGSGWCNTISCVECDRRGLMSDRHQLLLHQTPARARLQRAPRRPVAAPRGPASAGHVHDISARRVLQNRRHRLDGAGEHVRGR